ncbi:serine/threonine-protein phosphatase 4 regulatory subunit 2-A isoform X2 [Colossoma macropomum]|uniref:serine/threonine-protein phosphatase 4 regulatory subunit 2-A isoform X2 n=1 Tax=Colossoma macropomum TaxID=42526 RepID=UPI0018647F4B|nr:serine/threonine-protein phosphatase 4 regulatory subunit 2-A isoform X2 [Colossoma macropomum]
MEIDSLLSAFRDFEKKGKKETCPILDQFLCHIAKTGETMIQWSQFKSYFLFKLEKVMDDFKASSPEQRGPANPNVEYIPFEEMKERILKIVDGYNGIPFTIQRLCELLTEPKRNYTGTDKFLRGVEKNVMVVSCVYPTSEKNGSTCVSRMNGVMFPGNASAFPDRNVNGPGTPRPLNRQKLSLFSSVATNGLPDSTENKEQAFEPSERTVSDSLTSEAAGSSSGPKKNKHHEDEDSEEEARHDSKRLKFDKDSKDEEEEEEGEEEEKDKEENVKEQPCPAPAESSSDVPEPSLHVSTELKDTDSLAAEDQEPSSTQLESLDEDGHKSGTEDSPGPSQSQTSGGESDISEQNSQPGREEPAEEQDAEKHDPVSSSSSSSSEEGVSSAEPASACSSSSTEPAAEGSSSAENSSDSSETADDPMEQD